MSYNCGNMRWEILSIGTTSARSAKMDDKMISLVELLNEFWNKNTGSWQENQEKFSRMMFENNFMSSKLSDEDVESLEKTARQKSSYLEQLGFVDDERKMTQLGKYLAAPETKDGTLTFLNNKQVAFIIGVLNFKIENNGTTKYVVRELIQHMTSTKKYKMNRDELVSKLLVINHMDDEQLKLYIDSQPAVKDLDSFTNIIHHQKGSGFNSKYFDLFRFTKEHSDPLLCAKKMDTVMSGVTRSAFRKEFFGTTKLKHIKGYVFDHSNENEILLAMLKAKKEALVSEYLDLNKRTLIATGIFSFDDEDNVYISDVFTKLVEKAELNMNEKISSSNEIFISKIDDLVSEDTKLTLIEEVEEMRSNEFEDFLNKKLTFDVVKTFILEMASENYVNISKFFNDSGKENATYAEFLVSVAFHYLTNRQNNFIKSWNGSLNSDNTPKRHAGGGVPDAVFIVNNETILVETTIQTGQQQVVNETGSISTHLHKINNEAKMAVLFAKKISPEAVRQFKLHRVAGERMYTMQFDILHNCLIDDEKKFELWDGIVKNV